MDIKDSYKGKIIEGREIVDNFTISKSPNREERLFCWSPTSLGKMDVVNISYVTILKRNGEPYKFHFKEHLEKGLTSEEAREFYVIEKEKYKEVNSKNLNIERIAATSLMDDLENLLLKIGHFYSKETGFSPEIPAGAIESIIAYGKREKSFIKTEEDLRCVLEKLVTPYGINKENKPLVVETFVESIKDIRERNYNKLKDWEDEEN